MSESLFKYPRTPHLYWLSERPARDDRVLSDVEAREFLSTEILIEEKVDGANLGISVTDEGALQVQNRGSFLEKPVAPQFRPLGAWLAERESALVALLGRGLTIFGEWCFAVHSAQYDRLPDWFLGFDVYDRAAERFWASEKRNELLRTMGIRVVPEIARGHFTGDELRRLLASMESSLGPGRVEGLYLRRESNGWLDARAKLVRPEFVQAIDEHWAAKPLKKNLVAR